MNKSTHRYTMVFKKPSKLLTDGLSRSEKYIFLTRYASQVRSQLENWLREKKLIHQVQKIEPETMFNVIFIDATEDIGNILREFPESVEVGEDKNVVVETYSVVP